MAGTGSSGSFEPESIGDINITPFVDIVLVLLVIFMVTAGFMVQRGIELELPQAATADQLKKQVTLAIAITADGIVRVNGEAMDASSLAAAFGRARSEGDKIAAMIDADKAVTYDRIVGVMDSLRQAGINDIAFQLRPLEDADAAPTK